MSSSFLSTFKIEKRTFLGKSSARITIFFSCMVGFLDNSTFEKLFFHGTLVKFSVNIFPAILTFEKSHKDDLQQIFLKLFFRIWDIFLYSVTNFAFVIVKAVSVEKYVAFSARHGKVLFISTLSLKKKKKDILKDICVFLLSKVFFCIHDNNNEHQETQSLIWWHRNGSFLSKGKFCQFFLCWLWKWLRQNGQNQSRWFRC